MLRGVKPMAHGRIRRIDISRPDLYLPAYCKSENPLRNVEREVVVEFGFVVKFMTNQEVKTLMWIQNEISLKKVKWQRVATLVVEDELDCSMCILDELSCSLLGK
jgi:hypothetical protein